MRCGIKMGVKHDVSASFSRIAGASSAGGIWNQLDLKKPVTNSIEVEIKFQATTKELKFGVPESVVDQILAFHE